MTAHYFDTYTGAELFGVSPSTIRTWLERGHLEPGKYQRGRLVWTERQLANGQAAARRASVKPMNNRPTCSNGHPAQIYQDEDVLTLDCVTCGITIAMPLRKPPPNPPSPASLCRNGVDARETTIDPNEQGAVQRTVALSYYVDHMAHGPQVYFIRLGPYVKIGTTINVRRRLTDLSLQIGHLMATVDGGRPIERQIHQKYAHLSTFGEWFYLRDDLKDFVISRQREQIAHVLKHTSKPT